MSFSFSLFYLIRSQENHRAPDAKLNGEQNRHANLYDTALKVLIPIVAIASKPFQPDLGCNQIYRDNFTP